jgi:ribosomal protein S3
MKIIEIKNPDCDARLIGEAIAEQLKKRRASFRRVLKHALPTGAMHRTARRA